MRIVLAALLLAGCASAPVVTPAAPPAVAEAPKDGGIELTQAICMHGVFGFHFKTDGASEGNAYMPLRMLAALCRAGQDDDTTPQSDESKPLPPGVERL